MSKRIFWILGGVDSNGRVIAHKSDVSKCHTSAQKATRCCWRWNIRKREFEDLWGTNNEDMDTERLHAVQDWLVKHGHATDDDFTYADGTRQRSFR